MATNFGPEATQASDIGNNVTPQEGVVKNPAGLKALGSVFDAVSETAKAIRKDKDDEILSQYVLDLTALADSVEQGKSPSWAQSQMRHKFQVALNAHPRLRDKLIAAQNQVSSSYGIGAILQTGNLEHQRRQTQVNDLIARNILRGDETEAEIESALAAEQVKALSIEQYEAQMRELNARAAVAAADSAEAQAIAAKKASVLDDFVRSNWKNEFDELQSAMLQIVQSGASSIEKEDQINQLYRSWLSEMDAFAGKVDSELFNSTKSTFDTLHTQMIEAAKGERELKALENGIKLAVAKQEALMMVDPDTAKIVALSNLVGADSFGQLLLMSKRQDIITKFFGMISDADPSTPAPGARLVGSDSSTRQATKTFLEEVSKTALTGDAASSEAAVEALNNAFEMIERDEGSIRADPKEGLEIIKWLSTPQFKAVYEKHRDKFTNVDGVRRVFTEHVVDEITGMVDREFKKDKVVIVKPGESAFDTQVSGVSPESLVQVSFDGDAVVFSAIDPENKAAARSARILNKDLAPTLLMTLKAAAHLSGTSYEKEWERFSSTVGLSVSGGDTGDDLDMSSFSNSTEKLEAVKTPENWPYIQSNIFKGESGGDYDALFDFSNRPGGKYENVKLTSMTLDEWIEFSDPNGDYGQTVKRQIGRVATPMGAYQVVGSTLRGVKKALGLSGDEVMDKATQDKIGQYIYLTQGTGAWEGYRG